MGTPSGAAWRRRDEPGTVPGVTDATMGAMGVREDCRHYVGRTTSAGDVVRRCRVGANSDDPFACPADCLFFEARSLSGAGWAQAPSEPMSNTAHGLIGLPPTSKRRRKRR